MQFKSKLLINHLYLLKLLHYEVHLRMRPKIIHKLLLLKKMIGLNMPIKVKKLRLGKNNKKFLKQGQSYMVLQKD